MTATIKGELLTVTAAPICDHSDLPRWLCPHCGDHFGKTLASLPPVAPDKPRTIAGYWSIHFDGRAGHVRQWTGLTRKADKPDEPVIVDCDHPTDAVLCSACVEDLRGVLADVPALIHDLDLAITRDTAFVEHGTTKQDQREGGERRPWNERAARARLALIGFMGWACKESGSGCQPTASAASHARHIAQHIHRFARHPDANHIAGTISRSVASCHRAIERPADPWYYGPCPECGHDLYGDRIGPDDKDGRVTCHQQDCTYSAEFKDHQLTQLDLGENRMLTVDELVGAIARVDEEPVSRAQIMRWVNTEGVLRGERVEPRWENGRIVTTGQDTYRLGDIRQLADGQNLEAHGGTVTLRELARECGVSEAALWKAVERGAVEPVRKGAKPLRFTEAEAERYRLARKAS